MVACQVSNYCCAERELRLGELNWDALGLGADGDVDALTREGVVDRDTTLRTLREQVKAVPDFYGKPMAPVDVDKYVVRVSAQRVESAMPFDVRAHPYAQSAVAEAMMSRLEADMEKLAKRSETSTVPELRTHDGRALGTCSRAARGRRHVAAARRVRRAARALRRARAPHGGAQDGRLGLCHRRGAGDCRRRQRHERGAAGPRPRRVPAAAPQPPAHAALAAVHHRQHAVDRRRRGAAAS
jgi:hypothetical protein